MLGASEQALGQLSIKHRVRETLGQNHQHVATNTDPLVRGSGTPERPNQLGRHKMDISATQFGACDVVADVVEVGLARGLCQFGVLLDDPAQVVHNREVPTVN